MTPRPHACPDCRCTPDDDDYRIGKVNKAAPFYPLVELVMAERGRST